MCGESEVVVVFIFVPTKGRVPVRVPPPFFFFFEKEKVATSGEKETA